MWVWSLGWEDPLEEEMATHSSVLAWEIPWTEEPGRLQSMGLKRVRYNLVTKQLQVIFSLAFIWVYKSQLLVVGLMDMSLSKLQEMVCWSLWGHKELDTTATMCGYEKVLRLVGSKYLRKEGTVVNTTLSYGIISLKKWEEKIGWWCEGLLRVSHEGSIFLIQERVSSPPRKWHQRRGVKQRRLGRPWMWKCLQ